MLYTITAVVNFVLSIIANILDLPLIVIASLLIQIAWFMQVIYNTGMMMLEFISYHPWMYKGFKIGEPLVLFVRMFVYIVIGIFVSILYFPYRFAYRVFCFTKFWLKAFKRIFRKFRYDMSAIKGKPIKHINEEDELLELLSFELHLNDLFRSKLASCYSKCAPTEENAMVSAYAMKEYIDVLNKTNTWLFDGDSFSMDEVAYDSKGDMIFTPRRKRRYYKDNVEEPPDA